MMTRPQCTKLSFVQAGKRIRGNNTETTTNNDGNPIRTDGVDVLAICVS
jgi:hypothetical protein